MRENEKKSATALRERLLVETLQYVLERVPYYRRHPAIPALSAAALSHFPLLNAAEIAKNLTELIVLDRFPDYLITSGGSGDVSSVTFRNAEEYEAVHYYFTGHEADEIFDSRTLDEFGLDIFFNSNGYYWRKPRGWPLVSIALEQVAHAGIIERLIRDGLPVQGRILQAKHVQAQNGPMRVLTGYFSAKGFRPSEYDLKTLSVYGAHITKVWKERFQELWGRPVMTLYGLSEFAGSNALECPHCHGYHHWTCWTEFLALDSELPVAEGDARLVLTSLVPFARIQPRVRYLTGDIVTLTGYCAHADQFGFRFRGRISSSVIVEHRGKKEVLLSEIDLLEVVDRLPDIASRPHSAELQIWSNPSIPHPPFRMGFPQFRITEPETPNSKRRIKVSLEVTFDPTQNIRRAGELHELFLSILYSELPDLDHRLVGAEIALELEFLTAGALKLNAKSSV